MTKLVSIICAAVISVGASSTTITPTYGAPIPTLIQSHPSLVLDVNHRRNHINNRRYKHNRYRNGHRGFYRRGNTAYYNGRRGYRDYRGGYRYYNGFWFPGAAFIAGAIIGGAISSPRWNGNDHVSWCYDRYRSYRAYDNTFQPYHGPRRACRSPYR